MQYFSRKRRKSLCVLYKSFIFAANLKHKNNMKAKNVIMAAVLLMTALTANAQREVGTFTLQPKVGITVSNLTNSPSMSVGVASLSDENPGLMELSFNSTKEKVGLVAGFEAEYQMTRKLSISAGLLYSMQGAKYDDCDGVGISVTNAKTMLEYINIPIMANFYIAKGLALRAGLQPSFCVKNEAKADVAVRVDPDWTTYKAFVSCPNFNTFDLSIPVGASYEYHDFVLGATYNIGVTNVYGGTWDGGGKPTSHNSVFQVTLGYKFGL